jgi:DNA primase
VHYGFHAAAMLGSYLSAEMAFYLRFVPKIFVSVDNDGAGNKALDSVRRLIPHAKGIRQGVAKDSDDLLKTDHRTRYKSLIQYGISTYSDVVLR